MFNAYPFPKSPEPLAPLILRDPIFDPALALDGE